MNIKISLKQKKLLKYINIICYQFFFKNIKLRQFSSSALYTLSSTSIMRFYQKIRIIEIIIKQNIIISVIKLLTEFYIERECRIKTDILSSFLSLKFTLPGAI
jgi:hypothetical protein